MPFAQLFAGVFVMLPRILLTWFDPGRKTRGSKVIVQLTEPLLAALRRRLPSTGAFDASAVLWLVILGLVWRLLL